jgi:Phosphodiester glycosidase
LRLASRVKRTGSVILILFVWLASAAHAQQSKSKAPDRTAPSGDCSTKWETVKPEIEYRTIRCIGDPGNIDLHLVRIDPRKWNLDTLVSRNGTYAKAVARDKDAAFAVNANFFDKARAPLGIVVRSGETVQKPRETSWQSIFLISESGRARIVLPDKYEQYRKSTWMAVQAGPRLVAEGHTVKLKPNYSAPRVGVCIQWDRDVIFFATPSTQKFHVTEIAKIARRKEAEGGLACRDAMLFDGGHSVNFFVGGDEQVSISGDPVPVYIYATEKKK